MLKVGLIILALIAMVGTTTHYAFANNMGGPSVQPLCSTDTGGGMNMAPNTSDQGSGGGGSSTGSSDTTTSPSAGAGSGGGSESGNSYGLGNLRPFEPEPAVQQGEWYHHHHFLSHPRGWEPEPSTQISPWYQHYQQDIIPSTHDVPQDIWERTPSYHHHMGGMYGSEEYPHRHHHYDALIGDAIIRDPTTGAPSAYNAIPIQK